MTTAAGLALSRDQFRKVRIELDLSKNSKFEEHVQAAGVPPGNYYLSTAM
jgi:hypothetical protein